MVRAAFCMLLLLALSADAQAQRVMERLGRGVVAVRLADGGTYLGWRLLGTDPQDAAFNVYRVRDGQATKVNAEPLTGATNWMDPQGQVQDAYQVAAVVNGKELPPSKPQVAWSRQYLEIPLNVPPGGVTPDGKPFTYSPNDASVGDLDGDGDYEIVLKWVPSNAKDNSQNGYTGPTMLEALKMNGKSFWRINLGINIRSGAHCTQFLVYDFDSDGKAEVACKTADGTMDGAGKVIGDPEADHRDQAGRILRGPEFLTVFSGLTGAALATVDYVPARGRLADWGDTYGNRVDRFLACVAYLDGRQPSLVMCRGYYTGRRGEGRNILVAWNFRHGELERLWTFEANGTQNRAYLRQGSHSIAAADVDGDGNDEILYGAMAVDHDGKGLYSTGLGHGDAQHLGDLDPSRPGLELFMPHESGGNGVSFRDAATGKILWQDRCDGDIGRGVAADIAPEFPGAECWAAQGLGLYNCKGEKIGPMPGSMNFLVWWDGDPLREILDKNWIAKYSLKSGAKLERLLTAEGCSSNNGTKATPCLSADLLGDWREEVIWRTSDNKALRIYTTIIPTELRIPTLMHDPVYRLSIAWQNVAYNQPPHTGFFLGDGMKLPPHPRIVCPGGQALRP